MPELPEVETTRAGIYPHLIKRRIRQIVVRQLRLRWPIDADIDKHMRNRQIERIDRRGKYILIGCGDRHLLLHLGMSGSLRIVLPGQDCGPQKHEHYDLVTDQGVILRYHDPRRFGALLYYQGEIYQHPRLRNLGPEPFADTFDSARFYQLSRGRKQTIKHYLMQGKAVTGVGNIYANEALFLAGIRPGKAAGRVGRKAFIRLHQAIIEVIGKAIAAGGTTLKDFSAPGNNAQGINRPGYFQQQLWVYGRAGKPCKRCGSLIKSRQIAQRNSFYCPQCQG